MNVGELIWFIERFFLDIIGMIIPGYLFTIGVWIILGQPIVFNTNALTPFDSASNDLFLLIVAYVSGYAITSIGENIFLPVIERISTLLRGNRITSHLVPKNVIPHSEIMERITNLENYKGFVHKTKELYPWLDQNLFDTEQQPREKSYRHEVRRWRNIALTISSGNSYIVYRFMFISLLNLGIATVLILCAICPAPRLCTSGSESHLPVPRLPELHRSHVIQ